MLQSNFRHQLFHIREAIALFIKKKFFFETEKVCGGGIGAKL